MKTSLLGNPLTGSSHNLINTGGGIKFELRGPIGGLNACENLNTHLKALGEEDGGKGERVGRGRGRGTGSGRGKGSQAVTGCYKVLQAATGPDTTSIVTDVRSCLATARA